MNILFKLFLSFLLLTSSVYAGWKWNATKGAVKIGAAVYAGHKVKKLKNPTEKIFTKKEVKGRIVYQKEIDQNMIVKDKFGNEVNNFDRMKAGRAPLIKKNGRVETIELHHSRQNDKGSLFELSKSTHSIKDKEKGANALHPYGNKKNPNNPVPSKRTEFNKERTEYWKNRAAELKPETKTIDRRDLPNSSLGQTTSFEDDTRKILKNFEEFKHEN